MMTRIFSTYPEYDVYMEEIHHTEKKDAPSGTALFAAMDVLKLHPTKESWQNERVMEKKVLSLVSKREPDVPGTHTITFESDIDKIELTHTAHSRKGFAMGALMAAQWLKDKKGAYTMDDVLGFNK
jgi:4-hydroxy-tetrahydrodipicolinate reductase